jgi:DNA-binding NtrC family response regulator
MKRADPPLPKRAFRLLGEVGGASLCVLVDRSPLRLGSAPDNDAVIPVRAVSRHHAALHLSSGGLEVEDLGSRNGTFVNGDRVERAPVAAGDILQLGPVALALEEVPPGDAELAMTVEPDPIRERPSDIPEPNGTDGWAEQVDSEPQPWLPLLAHVVPRLLGAEETLLGELLGQLGRGLGATGATVLTWEVNGGEPVVVAAWGRPPTDPDLELVEILRGDLARGGKQLATHPGDGAAHPACGVVGGGADGATGLVLLGDFPGRPASGPLLELLLATLARCPRWAPGDPAPHWRPDPELVLPDGYVVGHSTAAGALHAELRRLVSSDLPVLISGETGVGKELVARILHDSSPRRDGPFVAVNCAAIPADLLEAELFGIERGTATGVSERAGCFQHAAGGVLLLDEIGEMPVPLQAKLLRVLQERAVRPVGARRARPVDARVLSATNSDLEARMAGGAFRRDLYYRVAGFVLEVPPLRARREDIPLLVESFLRRASAELGRPVRGLTVRALRTLVGAPWPGNIRQLDNEVRRLVHRCPPGHPVDSSLLSASLLGQPAAPEAEQDDLDLGRAVDVVERRLIEAALERTGGNRSRAAGLLGLSRPGLRMKLRRLGIEGAADRRRDE